MIKLTIMSVLVLGAAQAADWSEPAEVHHDDALCLSYQARLDGPYLVVRAKIEPGWHTFAMDNKQRAEEKLAGKRSLGIDHPTEITVTGGLEVSPRWLQSPPKDFSKPELRWFSWGFEREALFVAKVQRTGETPAQLTIRGQACTETTCKNIDVTLSVPPVKTGASANGTEINLKDLVPLR